MHLLELQQSTTPPTSWAQLELRSGVPKGNLWKIARGERGWDVATGALMMEKLGIDLNEQTVVFVKRQRELAEKKAKAA